VRGAEIAAAVARMPARHRKLHEVDFVAALDVFEDRTALNHVRLDRLHRPQLRAQGIDQRNGF
jgi:hypothetical protein